jgi:S1-C subfamily serine protease
MLVELSKECATLAKKAGSLLVHIGGRGIPGRTGIIRENGLVVSVAREAEEGESVPLIGPGGAETVARVRAFDSRTGIVILEAEGAKSAEAWIPGEAPAVGNLALAVAFASSQGVEASLRTVRFVGKENSSNGIESIFQLDGSAFPGFTGAAVVSTEGKLIGMVAENAEGNDAWVLPLAGLDELVGDLKEHGSWKRAWIGVGLMPVRLDEAQAESAGQDQALVITRVEESGPGKAAGLRVGDLLLAMGGKALRNDHCCGTRLPEARAGVETVISALRDGKRIEIRLVPAARKD